MVNPDDIDKGSLVRYDPDLPGIDKLFDKVFDIGNIVGIVLQKRNKTKAAKCIMFAGIIRGEGNIYQYCIRNNKRFLYMDHAYINRGYSPNPEEEWMRITDSRFSWNVFEERTPDRFNNFFAVS